MRSFMTYPTLPRGLRSSTTSTGSPASSREAISSQAEASVKWLSRIPSGFLTSVGFHWVGAVEENAVLRLSLRLASTAN